MRYTLLTRRGTIMRFYILACAMAYQEIYGGVIIDEAILGSEALDNKLALV